ncbi:MAG: hypothetical protein KKD38_06905 [Candidatus Delongbacteria bacterium]|nr:hypothetical protein [Candidatus Delongbacteria bacterium]MCG2759746.1 hypothetical protein [Candidatus Delongbacteria bacterium]
MKGRIVSINIADEKKKPKRTIAEGLLVKDIGLDGDAYNKPGARQISITSVEEILAQKECQRVSRNPDFSVKSGDFSETLTIEGIHISQIEIGDIFHIGKTAVIKISEKGMSCYKFCPCGKEKNECPLPKHFLFAEVIENGTVKIGDEIIFCYS